MMKLWNYFEILSWVKDVWEAKEKNKKRKCNIQPCVKLVVVSSCPSRVEWNQPQFRLFQIFASSSHQKLSCAMHLRSRWTNYKTAQGCCIVISSLAFYARNDPGLILPITDRGPSPWPRSTPWLRLTTPGPTPARPPPPSRGTAGPTLPWWQAAWTCRWRPSHPCTSKQGLSLPSHTPPTSELSRGTCRIFPTPPPSHSYHGRPHLKKKA